jgi:hypothetical protein
MKKEDKLTKTRGETDRKNVSGHKPENSEMPEYSTVRNFEIYLEKLLPQRNRLWQFHECWFQSTHYDSRHKSASSVASASGNIYHIKSGMPQYIPYGYLIAE